MPTGAFATWTLSQEALALRSRLDRVRPIMLQETMLPAAVPSAAAIAAIDDFLARGRFTLRQRLAEYLAWLDGPLGMAASPAEANRRFTFLRLRFNAILTQFDIFAEATSQRSEAETGIWLRGLEVAAADALALPGWSSPPPVLCYLARDAGGAIRRARTRLPGGGENPVALVRLPRERMVGSGIASSLVHEVGHQGAESLGLTATLREALLPAWPGSSVGIEVQRIWWRCLSEIVADLWAIGRVGIASTLGLISLVSLPRAFVMRVNPADPHPAPWIRVRLSCAIGDALYPHPQWRRYAQLWASFYPLHAAPTPCAALLHTLDASIPEFVERLLGVRAQAFAGRSLATVLRGEDRDPHRLSRLFDHWRRHPELRQQAAPTLAFAVLGQARADGAITPQSEGNMVADLLRHWAFRSALEHARACGAKATTTVNVRTGLRTSAAGLLAGSHP